MGRGGRVGEGGGVGGGGRGGGGFAVLVQKRKMGDIWPIIPLAPRTRKSNMTIEQNSPASFPF